jgi:heptosyltransferase-2
VLLIRLSALGDVTLATAAVEALRHGLPGAEVHVLTKPVFRDVFRGNPGVSRVLAWHPSAGVAALAAAVRAEGYEWVVDLHGNLRTRLLRLLALGPRWSVYKKGVIRRRLSVRLGRPELLDARHVVDRFIQALAPLGIGPTRHYPRVYPDPDAETRAQVLLRGAGWDGKAPLVALAPGAKWQTKAWPKEGWAQLVDAIEQDGLGFPVLLGGEGDRALCREVLVTPGGRGANLAGETTIGEMAAALRRCTALVTNDSAPLHVAAAVGTPVVALFGPTVRGFGFYPLGPRDRVVERNLDCRPCSLHGSRRCPEGHHSCLRDLRPATVAEALRHVIQSARGKEAKV